MGTLMPHIAANVLPLSEVHTDELNGYQRIGMANGYTHKRINHSAKQYVGKGGVTVNSIEGYWAQLKRSINGTHIHVSAKHLPKYLGEFEFRHNWRNHPEMMLSELMTSFAR
jgi:transposase-like protein